MAVEQAPVLQSVVIAINGESKCGKTTVTGTIASKASDQAGSLPDIVASSEPGTFEFQEDTLDRLAEASSQASFGTVTDISSGNFFRAATFYRAMQELKGVPITAFVPADARIVRELATNPEMLDILQNDPNIGAQVSTVGRMAGAQALCGTLFAEAIYEAYSGGEGGNLVVADGRNPVGHMERANRLGRSYNQIHPGSIIPIYVDTPPEVAASRMSGDYETNLATVLGRREEDTTRKEHPVVRPSVLVGDYFEWTGQILDNPLDRTSPVDPYRLQNAEQQNFASLDCFSSHLAGTAIQLSQSLARRPVLDYGYAD